MGADLTRGQRHALLVASLRYEGNVCPTSARGAAQHVLLRSLRELGLITSDPAPVITEAGAAAIADMTRTPAMLVIGKRYWPSPEAAERNGWRHPLECIETSTGESGVFVKVATRSTRWIFSRTEVVEVRDGR